MRSLSVILLSLLFFTLVSAAPAPQLEELIKSGEKANLLTAKTALEESYKREPANLQTLLLLAETHFYLGDLLSGEEIKIWEQGRKYAQAALALEPNSPDAHYWEAALMGKIGNQQGILKSLFLVNPMLTHLEKTLELEPDHSWAHFVLSHLYAKLPSRPLGKGDPALALEYAKRAYELEPEEPEFVIQYGELLLEQKQEGEAETLLLRALESPEVLWTDHLATRAKHLLDKLN